LFLTNLSTIFYSMTIRCIAFDLDDTLWECHPVIKRAEQCFYDWLKIVYPKICQKYSDVALIEHRIAYTQSQADFHHDLTTLRKSWMGLLADEFGYSHALVDSGFEVFWLARNEVTFFDGTIGILEDLASRYSLGVITNGNADVHHIGVGYLFDFTLSSETAGVSKPHPDIFHQAIKLSKFELGETIYVGDDPKRDIIGAQKAGMKAIWYNPNNQIWQEQEKPFATINHLSELEEKIRGI